MLATEYKSTPARLAHVFRRSRDTWKQRAAEKQRAIKKLRITVRDLKDSRDHWKALNRQKDRQIAELKTQLSQAREEPPAGGP